MPEGDTLYRTAVRLRPALQGQRIEEAGGRAEEIEAGALVGKTVRGVEVRGKHLLIHFAEDLSLHSHLGMTGAWHVYARGEAWRRPESRAALALKTASSAVGLFAPKTLELLTPTALKRHRWLGRLGPDILAEDFDVSAAVARLKQHDRSPIGVALMNQTVLCGVGNVYKSECLFLARLNPFDLVGALDDESLRRVVRQARELMRRNLSGYPRRTRHALDGERLWVYGRHGKPCPRCGTAIALRRQGDLGRTTYWCPSCQAVPVSQSLRD